MEHDDLIIDPILPKKLDGMVVELLFKDVPISIFYHYGEDKILLNGSQIPYRIIDQKYRHTAILVDGNKVKNSTQPIRLDVYFTDKER